MYARSPCCILLRVRCVALNSCFLLMSHLLVAVGFGVHSVDPIYGTLVGPMPHATACTVAVVGHAHCSNACTHPLLIILHTLARPFTPLPFPLLTCMCNPSFSPTHPRQNFMVRAGDPNAIVMEDGSAGRQRQVYTAGEQLPDLKVVQSQGWELHVYYRNRCACFVLVRTSCVRVCARTCARLLGTEWKGACGRCGGQRRLSWL